MRTLITLALTTTLTFAVMTLTTPMSHASNCFCGPGGMTPEVMAFGSTCAEAQGNLIDALEPYISCGIDGSCGYTVIYSVECFGAKIGVYSKGRLRYNCLVCY
ncbi:MAG: hypothetical protein QNK37_39070 [Acidobacteriota bacterium]|nr:hypothetical protein [Acidobacteriota bacterium]